MPYPCLPSLNRVWVCGREWEGGWWTNPQAGETTCLWGAGPEKAVHIVVRPRNGTGLGMGCGLPIPQSAEPNLNNDDGEFAREGVGCAENVCM